MPSLATISASAEFKALTTVLAHFIETGEKEEDVRVACSTFVSKALESKWPTYMLIKSLNDSSCYPEAPQHRAMRRIGRDIHPCWTRCCINTSPTRKRLCTSFSLTVRESDIGSFSPSVMNYTTGSLRRATRWCIQ